MYMQEGNRKMEITSEKLAIWTIDEILKFMECASIEICDGNGFEGEMLMMVDEIRKRYKKLEEKLKEKSTQEVDWEKFKKSMLDTPLTVIPNDGGCQIIDRPAERMMNYLDGMERAVSDIRNHFNELMSNES